MWADCTAKFGAVTWAPNLAVGHFIARSRYSAGTGKRQAAIYAARGSALHRIETLAKADCLQFACWIPAMRPPWYSNPTYRGCIIRGTVGDECWTVGTIKQRDAANPNYMSMLYSSPYQRAFFQPLRFWYSAVDDYEPGDANPTST